MDTEKVKKLTFGQKLGNLMSKLKKPKKEKNYINQKGNRKTGKKAQNSTQTTYRNIL